MGGARTSKSAVVLRDEPSSRASYDLRSWQGLTDVLRATKTTLSPEDHAAFRDLVLRYAQQGGDPELRVQIDAVLANVAAAQAATKASESAVVQEVPVASVPQRTTIGRRTAPRFGARSTPVAQNIPVPPPAPAVDTKPVPTAPLRTTPPIAPQEPKVEVPVGAVIPEPPVPQREPLPSEPETPRRVEESVSMPPQQPVEAMSSGPKTLDDHKKRITEIKRLVNEQIGNPVALVGAHKEMGREYMQALLSALKATGGGGTGVEAAMRRLEEAYLALLMKPETPDLTPAPPETPSVVTPEEVTATPEPSVTVVDIPDPAPTVVPEKETAAPVPAATKTPVIEEVVPEPVVTPAPIINKVAPEPVVVPEEVVPVPESPVVVPEPEPVTEKPIVPPAPPEPVAALSDPAVEKPTTVPEPVKISETAIENAAAPTPTPTSTASAAKESAPPFVHTAGAVLAARAPMSTEQAASPKSAPRPMVEQSIEKNAPAKDTVPSKHVQKGIGATPVAALAAKGINTETHEVQQSELASPRITQALQELLHEWSIFSSSGFLGIGPSGADHPLYIKLAPLSMGEIITGRYEGADRRVNNVIHDYVNAWRHEQGIAYTPSETFEHYLRRVVQRIQKRQQNGN